MILLSHDIHKIANQLGVVLKSSTYEFETTPTEYFDKQESTYIYIIHHGFKITMIRILI